MMIMMSGVGNGHAAMAVGRGTVGSADLTTRVRTVVVPHRYAVGLRSPPAPLKLGRRPQRGWWSSRWLRGETVLKAELGGETACGAAHAAPMELDSRETGLGKAEAGAVGEAEAGAAAAAVELHSGRRRRRC